MNVAEEIYSGILRVGLAIRDAQTEPYLDLEAPQ
jgi:hypothetical protein